jgi:hypothetical protein
VVRTDFSDDKAWDTVWRDIITPRDYFDEGFVVDVTPVVLPEFQGWTGEEIATLMALSEKHSLVLVVDTVTLSSSDHRVLVVEIDLLGGEREQPRSFRATPLALCDVVTNLSIANMDWEDFSEGVDDDGVLRHSEAT